MKKKLTLLGVLVVSFLFCLVGVKALDRVYPDYYEGDSVYWNDTDHSICYSVNDENCIEYTIAEDSDSTKDSFKVIDPDSQEKTFYKEWFIVGFALKATKETEITLPGEAVKLQLGDGDSAEQDGVTAIIYYDNYDDVIDAIVDAEEYDHIFTGILFSNVTIKKDTFVTVINCYSEELVVNGVLKAEHVNCGKISGTGVINVSYTDSLEGNYGLGFDEDNIELEDTPLKDANRFGVEEVSGVRVNIINEPLKDGLSFGYVGNNGDYTEKEAQEIINMYASVLNADGYDLVLAKYKNPENGYEEYYGKLVKKQEVANPKTSDGIINVIAILTLASVGAFVTVKKIKSN